MPTFTLRRSPKIIFTVIVCAVLFPSPGHATGFLIYNQHAAANALAIAYTAQVDNPSAVFYNPAAINQLSGTQISMGSVIIIPRTTFTSDTTGKSTRMKNHTYLLPNFYLTHKVNEKLSIGIGSFSPFGLCTDWPDDWEGNHISSYARLRTFFVNPVVSYQVNPKLSLAVGLNIIYSDLRFKRALKIKPLPFNLGQGDLDMDDRAYGFNLALSYRITDRLKLGLSYRSSIDVEYDGDADFRAPSLLKSLLPEGGVSLDIELPPIVATGIAAAINEKLMVEFDLIWVGFSTYDELHADFDRRINPLLKSQFAPIPRDYKDVLDIALSARYRATDSLFLLCGFLFDRSSAPEASADPTLPDGDKYIAGLGFRYTKLRWDFHVSYYAVFSADLNVRRNRDGFNGTYESYASLISISLDYRF